MIRPRKHLEGLNRFTQSIETRSDSLRLDLNELVPHIDEQVFNDILAKIEPWMFSSYPETQNVYQVLSNSLGVSTDHLILTSGSDGGIRQTIQVFCDPGDTIMISYPNFGMYIVYSQLFDLNRVNVCYDSSFTIDIDEFIESITDKTKIIVIANPNGAIGCVIPKEQLEDVIRKASLEGVVVLLDETYLHYYRDEWTARVDEFDNLVLIRTFSKAGGIAGLRFGYILTNPSVRDWIVKASPYMEINSISALAGCYLLENPQVIRSAVAICIEGREYLVQSLQNMGFEVYNGEVNFVLVKFGVHKESVYRELDARKIKVMDLSGRYLLEEYTRITAGPKKYMDIFIEAVMAAI